jgi:hypothetical protein
MNLSLIPLQRFTTNAFSHISGEEGNGPIKTYIHKVKIYQVFEVIAFTYSITAVTSRYILGNRFRTHIERWRRIQICKHSSFHVSSMMLVVTDISTSSGKIVVEI